MFLRCQTQWRSGPSGLIGLDYSVVMQFCDLYSVENKKELIDDLQVMEFKALELIDNQMKKDQKSADRKTSRRG
tara:strand:- start:2160 stop:2381 length:222 start_codon:yes stop_codon:yes gene_type:complete